MKNFFVIGGIFIVILCTFLGVMVGFSFSEIISDLPYYLEDFLWDYDDAFPYIGGISGFLVSVIFVAFLNDIYKCIGNINSRLDSLENRIEAVEMKQKSFLENTTD